MIDTKFLCDWIEYFLVFFKTKEKVDWCKVVVADIWMRTMYIVCILIYICVSVGSERWWTMSCYMGGGALAKAFGRCLALRLGYVV